MNRHDLPAERASMSSFVCFYASRVLNQQTILPSRTTAPQKATHYRRGNCTKEDRNPCKSSRNNLPASLMSTA